MSFTFHQALFGYDGGHQMLAASLQLPTEARHSLAVATDLSGSAPPVGFDSCYTGAPVSGTNFYSLFCTWLAPEMPRPGCVWSHVLLIDVADFAELRGLGALRDVFRRPSQTSDLDGFSRPRMFTDKHPAGPPSPALDPLVATLLLRGLYGKPEKSAVVTAAVASRYEELIFAMWSQQWPRLRRNFRFSTGSFADRGRIGVAFDLQVTPEANVSSWRGNRVLRIDPASLQLTGPPANDDELWLAAALDDLLSPDLAEFRTFLRTYGADVHSPRAAFRGIAEMYRRFGDPDGKPWGATLRTIAADFPMPDDAGTLKRASVSRFLSMPKDVMLGRLVESISFLCLKDATQAFARTEVDFGTAVADLWPNRKDAIWDILAQPPSSEAHWTALLQAVASHMSVDDLVWLAETHPEMIASLVRLNPTLAAGREVWRLAERSQWAIIEGLESASVSSELWRAVTRAMLEAGTAIGVREVVHLAGKAALHGALEWLVNTSPSFLPALWREVLRGLAEERLETKMLPPLELAFCAAIAPSTVAARLSAARPDLQTLALEPLENLPVPLRLPTAFLLMTLGLQASPQAGAPLIARGFFAVHDALEDAVEPPEAWRLLQPHLPMVWFWQEWDRCFRLRRALQKWLDDHPETRSAIAVGVRSPADSRLLESLS